MTGLRVAPKVISDYIWFGDDQNNDNNYIDNDSNDDDDFHDDFHDDDRGLDHDHGHNHDNVSAGWKIRTGDPERQSASRRERVRHVGHGKLNHGFLYDSNIDNGYNDHGKWLW